MLPSRRNARPTPPGDGAERDGRPEQNDTRRSSRWSPNADEFTLGDIFRAIRRQALLVAYVAVACEGIAAIFAARERPMFRTTAVLRFTDPRKAIPQGIAPVDRDPNPPSNIVLSQMELLRSKTLIGLVVDSLNLRLRAVGNEAPAVQFTGVRLPPDLPRDTVTLEFSPTLVIARSGDTVATAKYGDTILIRGAAFAVAKPPQVSRARIVVLPRDEAIDWFDSRLDVSQRGQTELVDVSFSEADPATAQAAVNALVDRYRKWNVATAQAEARERRKFLKEQLAEIDSQRVRAERALTDFRQNQRGYGSRENIQAQQTALFTLDMRSQELNADRSVYQSLLRRIEDATAAKDPAAARAVFSAPDLSANPVVGQLYTQLAQYQAARDSMTGGNWSSAPTNPDVKRLDELIASAEQRLVAVVRGQVSSLDARIGALDTLRRRTVGSLQSLPRAQSTEEQLQRAVETDRTLVAALRAEYENARIAEAVNLGTMQVVDPAPLPYRSLRSLRLAKLTLGLLVGLVLGSIGAIARDVTDAAIRGHEEVENRMQMPVLSIIPGLRSGRAADRWRTWLTHAQVRVRKNGHERVAATMPPLAHVVQAPPAASEAYRILRTNLTSLQAWNGAVGQTFVVTSALMSEGKTTIATNLALAFALEGKRTLLIDADLRRSRIHKVFQVPREPGLAQVLRGYAEPPAAIRATFMEGLFILPAGRLGSHPSDLLSADRMRKLLSRLADHFDVIIVDTPPVLPVADATIVAPLASGVLMVVRAGETGREAFDHALQLLHNVDARVVGAVLNDSGDDVARYGGYVYEAAD